MYTSLTIITHHHQKPHTPINQPTQNTPLHSTSAQNINTTKPDQENTNLEKHKTIINNNNNNNSTMGFTMGLNLLLLLAMVATNIFSLYHLSSTITAPTPTPTPSPPIPDHLLHQLSTIRATINHLTSLQHPPSAPSDLLLYAHINPIASSCKDNPTLLHQYMNYTPFKPCPHDHPTAESLILRGCHPLPRRRCFSTTPPSAPRSLPSDPFAPLPEKTQFLLTHYPCNSFSCFAGLKSDMGFDMKAEKIKFLSYRSDLDLPISQLLQIAKSAKVPIRLALDVGGGTGTFAAQMKLHNVTVVTTTMNLGAPYNEAVAVRGLVPLHAPLQQRLPVFDGVLDLVRCGHAVNRWIPVKAMEFLFFDVDRVLRGGGFLWLDHFFSKKLDLEKVFSPLIGKLGYKKVKWAVGDKSDASGVKNGEVYLTALLQKPLSK